MKKTNRIYKVLCFIMILSLVFSIIKPAFALTNPAEFEIEINDVIEPAIGEKPSFDYDFTYTSPTEHEFETYDFLYWLETDVPYSETLEQLNNMDSFDDLFESSSFGTGALYNNNNDTFDRDPIDFELPTISKFKPNRTYGAVFYATFYDNIVESYVSKIVTRSVPSTYDSNDLYIETLVNGKGTNVKVIAQTENSGRVKKVRSIAPNQVIIIALYDTTIPQQNYKATVNWINAEGKIPESFVLKLMNGSNVVKEQVITKDNAVDEDTWEYDFGEYPTLDDNGNEITYTLAYSEGKDGDLKFFESNQDGFVINNTYIAPEISSKVKMRSLADREKNNVKYRIDYNASIKKYSGNADVVLTTTLPFAIDEAKSNLDDGTYDAKTKTITWNYTIENIDKMYDYSTTKNLDLYATAVLPYAIEAKTVGEIALTDAEGFSESVDAIDNIEAGTGNPKTGDINLQKYLSIGLIGIAAILMVVSIRRKYSTRKSKVQF